MDYQKSSNKVWYTIGIIVLAALAFWYYSAKVSPATSPRPSTATQQAPVNDATAAASISSDLSNIPDNSAGLNQAASASAAAIQAF